MKRFTALQFTAIAALWLGHASTCAALPEPHPDFAECDRKVREAQKVDLKDSQQIVGGILVEDKFSEPFWALDISDAVLLYPHSVLLEDAATNKHKPRVSNAQSQEAKTILGRYYTKLEESRYVDSPISLSWGVYGGLGEEYPDYLHYRCISEVCPRGGCTILEVGERPLKSLPLRRKFFNKAMNWAKKVNRLRKKVPAFERRYNREERKLRATVAKLPERLYVIDYVVPGKQPVVPR